MAVTCIYTPPSPMCVSHADGLCDLVAPAFLLLPKSEQDERVWWFCPAFSIASCWSHAHFKRLQVNVSISRKVGQLVCHS